jgi:hypothetical protein
MRAIRHGLDSLRAVRVSHLQLGAVAACSVLASVVVLNSGSSQTPAQAAALAALKGQPSVVSQTPPGSAGTPASSGGTPAVPVSVTPAAGGGGGASAGTTPAASSDTGGANTGGDTGGTTSTTPSTTNKKNKKHHKSAPKPKHQVGHVFVIALSTPSFEDAWGTTSSMHYLDGTLKKQGVFLGGYETLGSAELPDYLAMVSGQAPNPDTEAECATYSYFSTSATPSASGQVPGSGCVYPNTALTVADQVTEAGKVWRGYIDGLTSETCVHPNSGALDDTPLPYSGADYDDRHNPFIYFGSLLDLGGCSENDVSLTQLPKDLKTIKSTAEYSYIAPGLCEDGSATSCSGGSPAGTAGEDAFLHQEVPAIERSAAYKKDGVIVIVFALSGGSGGASAPVGALVLSKWGKAGQVVSTTYNPYSILRGTEDLLGLDPLVKAKTAKSFITEALPGT